jgi:hypothetical protein
MGGLVDNNPRSESSEEAGLDAYEPPEVETVMDADELSREVHYAGRVPIS